VNEIVCNAIRARHLLRFIYEGYERIIEPHIHGVNSANHEMVSGWLVGGWTATRAEEGWRNYLVSEMHDVHALADQFPQPRVGYRPAGRAYRQVFCRIEGAAADSAVEDRQRALGDRPTDERAEAPRSPSAEPSRGEDDRRSDAP
jgi:hypothetical protein